MRLLGTGESISHALWFFLGTVAMVGVAFLVMLALYSLANL